MNCSGIHCAGCGGGAGVPVVALAVLEGFAWVTAHLIEVAVVSAACGALAVAAVVALMRAQERREARHAAGHPLLITRDVPPLAATVTPQVTRGTPPAIEHHYHGPQFIFSGSGEHGARVIRQALTGAAPAHEEIRP